ncbi:unnamed protein product, partial [Meganyctiphanes norvegica]
LQPGQPVSLKCIASGMPTPHITWDLDGFPLPQHDRLLVGQYVGAGGSVVSHVNLTTSRVEDGGSYSCKAENSAGSIKHSARLNVYGAAYVRPMGVVTAVSGERLSVNCPAAGHPLESITWTTGGQTLGRQNTLANGTLVVEGMDKSKDGATYTCTVRDNQGRTHSATATLHVLVPPSIVKFSFPEATQDERIQVSCSLRRGDLPLNITWLKDGHSLT